VGPSISSSDLVNYNTSSLVSSFFFQFLCAPYPSGSHYRLRTGKALLYVIEKEGEAAQARQQLRDAWFTIL
jgi:hypothetical protein